MIKDYWRSPPFDNLRKKNPYGALGGEKQWQGVDRTNERKGGNVLRPTNGRKTALSWKSHGQLKESAWENQQCISEGGGAESILKAVVWKKGELPEKANSERIELLIRQRKHRPDQRGKSSQQAHYVGGGSHNILMGMCKNWATSKDVTKGKRLELGKGYWTDGKRVLWK